MKKKFNAEIDSIIKQIMLKEGHLPKPFARIRKLIPQFKSKQIRSRWNEKLDPNLCHDPLNEHEQFFINQWVSTQKKEISWVRLRHDLNIRFNKFRSENSLKNYWYSEQRRLSRQTARVRPSNKLAISYLLNY
ncbi:hypothetical protein C1645_839748 [Glomus cerebriforme]|uniref:HTH myb-type domain-containing protein n=1 Tax=Glomus cerebriforme TaxID=658196 RepID=A0A397S2Z3_9GLOM|nr:hypothetical protein C1645_839748 [Glomus cerebriforme]